MRKKKILIFSATAGAGHKRAGDALLETAKLLNLPITIEHHDILDFTFPLFRSVYSRVNNSIANHAPELWGYLYKQTDATKEKKSGFIKMFDHFNYKKYLNFIQEFEPDAVLCTHFLPYAALTEELQKKSWKIPFFSIPTDYDAHSLWISPYVKHYYVATDEVAWIVASHGIKERNISITGIPISPVFWFNNKKEEARTRLGLQPDMFTIFILSGGYGVGVINELVPSLVNYLSTLKEKQFQIVVVCGKNEKLFEALLNIRQPRNIKIKIYPYITFVDELMDSADVLITKSGGLTVSEALAKHLPMIIFDAVPGQEGRNADYLSEQGTAIKASSFTNLHFKLTKLINNPDKLNLMKESAIHIAKPFGAKDILEDVLWRI